MAGFLDALRMMNIYNPFEAAMGPPNSSPGYSDVQGIGLDSNDLQMFAPEHTSIDQFNQLLGQYPQRQEPGMLRKIASIAAGIGQGPDAQEQMLNQPFYRQLEDWSRRISPTAQAANLERQGNITKATLAKNLATDRMGQRRLDISSAAEKEKERSNRAVEAAKVAAATASEEAKSKALVKKDELDRESRLKEITAQGDVQAAIEGLRQEGARKLDEQKKNEAAAVKTKERDLAMQGIQQGARDTLDSLNAMLDPKTDKLMPEIKDAVGKSRMFGLQFMPGSQTKKGDVAIRNFKAQQVISLIGQMKAQSRTGATGFGALNLKELGVLEDAANKLDPALDEDSFEAELKRIREKIKKILQPATGFDETITKSDAPGAQTIKRKMRNKKTGQEMEVISNDGGKTWKSADGTMTFSGQ